MVKINSLINPSILAEQWVGFNGDSEFMDSNGELQMGSWTYAGILKDEDIEYVDEKYGIFSLDDEINEDDVYGNNQLIPVWDSNNEFVACIQIHYRRN